MEYPLWLAGESQAIEDADQNGLHDSLLCKEIFYPGAPHYDTGLNHGPVIGFSHNMNGIPGDHNAPCGIADLENLELDTPPDFQLAVSFTSNPCSIQLNFTDITVIIPHLCPAGFAIWITRQHIWLARSVMKKQIVQRSFSRWVIESQFCTSGSSPLVSSISYHYY